MFLRILDRLEEILIASLMAGATLLIFAAVVHRYAVGIPLLYPIFYDINLSWAQELCIYMFVWMAKFGAAYGVRTGIHVGVDVLVNPLPPGDAPLRDPVRALLRRAVHRASSARWARCSSGPSRTPIRCPPTWSCRAGSSSSAMPLGSYLMCFRFLQVAWAFWRTGDLPHHDPAHVEGVIESPQRSEGHGQ